MKVGERHMAGGSSKCGRGGKGWLGERGKLLYAKFRAYEGGCFPWRMKVEIAGEKGKATGL